MEDPIDRLKEQVGNLVSNIDRIHLKMAELVSRLQSNTSSPIQANTPVVASLNEKVSELLNEMAYLRQRNLELEEKSKAVDEKNRMLKAALLMTVDHETKDVSESHDTLTSDQVIEVEAKDKTVSLTIGPSSAHTPVPDENQSTAELKCPKCAAAGAFILELADKLICGDCRHEWLK